MAGEENRTSVLYKAIADFSDLSKKAQKVRKDIKALRDEEARLNDSSVKGSKASTSAAQRETKATSDKVNALRQAALASEDAADATEEHAKATDKAAASSRRATTDARRLSNAVQKVAVTHQKFKKDANGAWREVERNGQASRRSSREISGLGRAMRGAHGQALKFSKALDRLGNWRPRLIPPFIALVPVIASLLALVNPLVAGLGAAGAAALGMGSSLASLAGSAVAAVPALATLLSVVSALRMAMGGVGGAFDAYKQQKKATGGGGGGGGAPRPIPRADLTLEEKLARAREDYRRAVEDVKFAEDDLDEAREGYTKRVNDLRKAVERAAAAERSAAADVQMSREELANVLADPGATKGQKMAAQAALESANHALKDVRDENTQNRKDLAELEKTGMEGDRDVIMAKRALTDANNAVRDAEIAVKNVTIDHANAQMQAASASAAAAAGANVFNDALAKLSPSARSVVLQLIAMEDAYRRMQQAVQESFFSQFVDEIGLLYRLFPPMTTMLTDTATALGQFVEKGLIQVTSDSWIRDIAALGPINAEVIKNIGDGLLSMLDSFRHLTIAAAPFLILLSESFAKGQQNFEDLVKGARDDGSLASWLETVYERMGLWWQIIKNIGATLFNYGAASGDFGKWITESFLNITEGWREASQAARQEGSPFKKYLEDIKPLLSELSGLLGDFFGWFAETSMDPENIQMMTDLVSVVREELGPALSGLLDTLAKTGIGESLVSALSSIIEAIDEFLKNGGAEGLKTFWETVELIFDGIADFAATAPEGLLSTLAQVFATLAVLEFFGINTMLRHLLRLVGAKGLKTMLTGLAGLTGLGRARGGGAAGAAGGAAGGAAPIIAGGGGRRGRTPAPDTRRSPGRGSANAARGGRLAGLGRGLGRLAGGPVGLATGIAGGFLLDNFVRDGGGGARDTAASVGQGALTGAGIGALVGSVVPGVGTALGGAVGGVVGAGAGLLGVTPEQMDQTKEDLSAWASGIGDWIGESAGNIWEGIQSVGDWLATQWENFTTWLSGIPDRIGTAAGNIWEGIQGIPDWLGQQWENFLGWLADLPYNIGFAAGALWGHLQNIGDWLAGQWENFVAWLGTLGTRIGELAQTIWDGMQSIGSWLAEQWTNFTTWLSELPGRIASLATTIWEGMQSIGSWLSTQWGNFTTWLRNLPTNIANLATTIWNGMQEIPDWLATQWASFSQWVRDLPTNIANLATNIWSGLTGIGSWLGDQWDTAYTWVTQTLPSAFSGALSSLWSGLTAGAEAGHRSTRTPDRRHWGGPIRRSGGGGVPGSGNSDTVPAMLTPGEFVIRKKMVNAIGEENLARLNSGVMTFAQMLRAGQKKNPGDVQFFNGGGLVPYGMNTVSASPALPGANTNIHYDHSVNIEKLEVNNPKPETASDSLPRTIRKMAYLGGTK